MEHNVYRINTDKNHYNKIINHSINFEANQPSPYFLIQNKGESINYDFLLPIAFTILFLVVLFLIYLVNTYCLKSSNTNNADAMCCLYKSDQELPRSVIYSNNIESNLQNQKNDYRRSLNSRNSYCEEARTGFYHVQKPNNFIGRTTFNHNYDKIYDSHPSNLILALQQRNFINESGKS